MRRTPIPFALAGLLACAAPVDQPQTQSPPTTSHSLQPKLLCQLADPRITESSGVAASQSEDGVYFTHNDSGDSARFFQFRSNGELDFVATVAGAEARDWEDMASATIGGDPWLYFGDIGDNPGTRKSVVVYRIPEPRVPPHPELARPARALKRVGRDPGQAGFSIDHKYVLRYPDGPHNAECLMVHPKSGDLYIVTKASKERAQVFWLPRPRRSGEYALKQIGTIEVQAPMDQARLITGGAISPDGRHVVIRTYLEAFEFRAPKRFNDWPRAARRPIRLNPEIQGEGIAYTRDGKHLITTSEGSPCPVSIVPLGR